jgi:serine/threonine-protein kinase
VTGQRESAATAALRAQDFTVKTEREASDSVDEGVVIRQTPAGGQQAPRGSEVTIVVSSGPAQVIVPGVRGLDQASAEAKIRAVGLVVGSVTSQPSQAAAGTVIQQSPGATAKVDRGSAVNIVVAAAPSTIEVPDVIGNTASDARFKLEQAGFVVTSEEAPSTDQPPGNVIDQNPSAGLEVAPGSTVTITVSTGGDTTAVPAPPPSDQGPQATPGNGKAKGRDKAKKDGR